MNTPLEIRCTELVTALGLASPDSIASVKPLTGGVASDIAAVDLGDRVICAKFALEKLRVAEDWQVPVGRNAAEYAWLEYAGKLLPGSVPEVFGRDTKLNGFAMEYLRGENIYLWKNSLLNRNPAACEGQRVGRVVGQLHLASAADDFDAARFQNQQDFYGLRLEPYLAFTAAAHRELRAPINRLIERQRDYCPVLIHGDVSPKNILFRDGQPVILDAECATMGDPSFDVAFCINHLLLKAFHMPDQLAKLVQEARSFWLAYEEHVRWETPSALEKRVCAILPALMLARIDGKSPVEYLNEEVRAQVRGFAIAHVLAPQESLAELSSAVSENISGGHIGEN